MARLIEDELIRTHWPIHNRAQKSIPMRIAILSYTDQRGFIRFHLQRQRHVKHAIRWFRREDDARLWLHTCATEMNLEPELLGLGSDGKGNSIPESIRDAHNLAMESLIQRARQREKWAIVDKGRDADEFAVILMENGNVKGWGYTSDTVERFDQIEDLITLKSGSATSDAIIQHALDEQAAGLLSLKILAP